MKNFCSLLPKYCLLMILAGGCTPNPQQNKNLAPNIPDSINLQDSVYSLIGYKKNTKTNQFAAPETDESIETDLQKMAQQGLPARQSQKPLQLPSADLPDLRSTVRVFLQQSSKPLLIKSMGSIQVKNGSQNLGRVRLTFVVSIENDQITVRDQSNKLLYTSDSTLFFESLNAFNVFTHARRNYRGNFAVFKNGNQLTLVNVINLEDYLRGVLPYEIPVKDHATLEAIKAQAVAARTYALKHLDQFPNFPFDFYPDERDQMYMGTENETFLSDLAVRETKGILLRYQGQLAQTYYHSTCGGHTTAIHDVWKSEPIRYLSARKDADTTGRAYCSASPYMHWYEAWSLSDLTRMIKTHLPDAGVMDAPDFRQIRNITIAEKSSTGRVKKMIIDTDKGPVEVYGDKVRWIFRQTKNKDRILPSSLITHLSFGAKVVMEGSGSGHGIGLCQFGALERARKGQSFTQILYQYYAGAELVQME